MQRPTHIWQHPLCQKHNGRVVSIRRHLLRLLMTWGLNLLDSSVNQSVSKRLFQYICPLVHLSVRFPFRRCKDRQNLVLSVCFSWKKKEYDAKKCRFRKILRKVVWFYALTMLLWIKNTGNKRESVQIILCSYGRCWLQICSNADKIDAFQQISQLKLAQTDCFCYLCSSFEA